ncbi:MAG: vitamin B12-dependent ribonucleotide reductase [Acidobacteriota bacterium]|jgi:ribonucleoside-diphosphate reductase alpha chain
MAAEDYSEPDSQAADTEAAEPSPQPAGAADKKTAAKDDKDSSRRGLRFTRFFTADGVHPYDAVEWESRDAVILNAEGEVVFEQNGVEFPTFWSQRATNIVASKYFHGQIGTPERETSLKQLIGRVVGAITQWGVDGEYFASAEDAEIFSDELTHLLLHQMVAFNSPVWFNIGVANERQQASACYINHVDDTMESILDLAKTEGLIFKWGSGAGVNLSRLRGSTERLSGGGIASGPVSFMKGFDAFAGVIKSGGKTRRAAKMVMLDVDHPDIVEFIECKAKEEQKAWSLIEAGYDPALDGEAYSSVFFQNANHSVRASDAFMRAVEEDREWTTIGRVDGAFMDTYPARELMYKIADCTHQCGDPGMQFDDTINRWHTCKNSDRIYGSNPCSEYMFLDETACNLASLNLMKFLREDSSFDVESYRRAVDVTFTGMEIIVGYAEYPTPNITKNSFDYRPLGLGYANLGALLMHQGLPYDSDAGRAWAAGVTSIMCGEAYLQSARIAGVKGPFAGYPRNAEPMLEVMRMHRDASYEMDSTQVPERLAKWASKVWEQAVEIGEKNGYRNAQATVLAPTGTISFMMDCDTTGVEPDLALVKHKRLVGGGTLRIVNDTVPAALKNLGYSDEQVKEMVAYVDEHSTIEGAPHLKEEHLPVFDCAFRAIGGRRAVHYMGHLKMVAAVQPFISGAISKTINVPENATTEEIGEAYTEAWRHGIKAVSIYRDGSKRTQPLATAGSASASASAASAGTKARAAGAALVAEYTDQPVRRKLPDERQSLTHKFSIGGHKGYITVGLFDDGTPGEIFITMAKQGSTISGLMDSFACMTSFALQYHVPLKFLVGKLSHARYEPSGWTGNPEIPYAKSITDYVFRWLGLRFLTPEERAEIGMQTEEDLELLERMEAEEDLDEVTEDDAAPLSKSMGAAGPVAFEPQPDAPLCQGCGSLMVRSGVCYKCMNCGATSGCS